MAREFSKSFYNSKAWEECRLYIVKKYHGLCAECEKPGEEVHHIQPLTPLNINNPDITTNEDNLVLLCKKCHFDKHRYSHPWQPNNRKAKKSNRKRITNNGMYFDEEGNYVQCKTYIVYGAPASGKTTYVRDNKKEGDLVVDLDLIMQAISMEDKARIANNLLDIAIGIRDYIYKRIEEKTVDSKNMWVIGLLPNKKEREELANRLNAEVIYMYSTIDECLERIKHDNERVDKELHKELIENWFAKHKA